MDTMIRPRHVLIIRTDHMGDMLLTLPAVLALKRVHPACRISILASPSNVEVVRRFPAIDTVEIDEVHAKEAKRKYLHGLVDLTRRLRALDCDVALVLHRRARWGIAVRAAGIPVRIGSAEPRYALYFNRRIDTTKRRRFAHASEQQLDLFAQLGVRAADLSPLTWPIRAGELSAADALLSRHDAEGAWLVVLHPGSRGSALNWSPGRYGELGRRLSRRGLRVAVTGGTREVALTSQVAGSIGAAALDLGGRLTVEQLAALMKRSALYVGCATGTTHLAAAVGIPVLGLYSLLATEPRCWRPLCARHTVLQPALDLECLRCLGPKCPDYNCVERHLGVNAAERAALELMDAESTGEANPPSPRGSP